MGCLLVSCNVLTGTDGGNRREPQSGSRGARKFLGFRINRKGQREVAPQNVERFKQKVREIWRSCRSVTSRELRDEWRRYVVGWWGYYRLAEERRNVFRLEGWIRRHMRKCFGCVGTRSEAARERYGG